jgi:hypothetical protein
MEYWAHHVAKVLYERNGIVVAILGFAAIMLCYHGYKKNEEHELGKSVALWLAGAMCGLLALWVAEKHL